MTDDALKTVRFAHRFLLGVLSAAVLFLASPRDSVAPYESAIVEVKRLATLDEGIREYEKAFRDYYDETRQEDIALMTVALEKQGYTIDREEIRPSDVIPYQIPAAPLRGTVSNWYEWLVNDQHWHTGEMRLDEWSIHQLLTTAPGCDVSSLEPPSRALESASAPRMRADSCDWKIIPTINWSGQELVPIPRYTLQIGGTSSGSESTDLPFFSAAHDRASQFDWLREHSYLVGLQHEDKWLPACRAVWSTIESENVSSAIRILKELADQHSGTLSLVGVRLSTKTLAVAIPLLTLSLLAFMTAHLRVVAHQITEVPNVAWICLYDNRFSTAIAIITVVVLPLVATIWALLAAKSPPWIVMSISLGCGVLGMTTVVSTFAARRRVVEIS